MIRLSISTYVGTSAIGAKHTYVTVRDTEDKNVYDRFSFYTAQDVVSFCQTLYLLLTKRGYEVEWPSDFSEWEDRMFDEIDRSLKRREGLFGDREPYESV